VTQTYEGQSDIHSKFFSLLLEIGFGCEADSCRFDHWEGYYGHSGFCVDEYRDIVNCKSDIYINFDIAWRAGFVIDAAALFLASRIMPNMAEHGSHGLVAP
jgi:hypothetical protein